MPRNARVLVDEGIYHVFNRGNNKRDLFLDESDFQYFYNKLLRVKTELGASIYHYCLMRNHFHILLRVQLGADLAKLFHRVQLSYARYFKNKYGFIGHIFQERFRSPFIPEESYYLQCGRYIERNPSKAQLVDDPADYQWCSAAFYLNGRPDPLITPNLYYQDLGSTPRERQKTYQKFLGTEEPYSSMIEQALIKS